MKRKLVFLIMMAVCMVSGFAQSTQKMVRGVVTSADDGSPIPGVSVLVKGSTLGTITGGDGVYEISVPADATILVFSFIGMETQEIAVESKTVINVVLSSDLIKVDEVIVTALGIKREKKALGYAVSEVKSEEIVNARETNIVNALAGKVAGVQINSSSGQPGGASRIVIRGNSSIQYGNQPLFVIDGMPIDNSEKPLIDGGVMYSNSGNLDTGPGGNSGVDIDPNSIENITVLKGASASALYGSRAANGVVLITTKMGDKGMKPQVAYSFTSSWDKIIQHDLQENWSQGWGGTYFDGETTKTSSSWGPRISEVPGAEKYDRWGTFQTGLTQEHNVSIRGGGKKASYFASISDYNQQGTLEPIDFERRTLLANSRVSISEDLTFSTSVNFTRTKGNRLFEGNSPGSFMNSFLGSPWTYSMDPAVDDNGDQRLYRNGGRNNYLWLLDNSGVADERERFITSFGLEYNLTEKLTVTGKLGLDMYNQKEETKENVGIVSYHPTGYYEVFSKNFYNLNSDIMVNYTTDVGTDFKLDAMIGNNITDRKTEMTDVQGEGFIIPSYYNLSNTQTQSNIAVLEQYRMVSVYGQVTASFRNYLFLTLTGRNDWSSTLPKSNNNFFYPSVSTGFVFSELLDNDWLNFGKLRVSYAEVGNDAPVYALAASYVNPEGWDPTRGALTFPYNNVNGYIRDDSAGNPNIEPEKTKEFEIGTEIKLFNNRVGLDASYYHKVSLNQIYPTPTAYSVGYTTALMNIGKMTNTGVELMAYFTPLKSRNFQWDVTLNWATNTNTVNKIADGVSSLQLEGFTGEGPFLVEGESYGVIYGYYAERDEEGRYVIRDDGSYQDGEYLYNQGKSKVLGKVDPDWTGGIRNTFSYKGLMLSAFVDMRFGGSVYNLDEYYLKYYGMSVTTDNRPDDLAVVLDGVKGHYDDDLNVVITGENDIEADYQSLYQNTVSSITEFNVQKNDYIKLRELSLAYQLPKKWLDSVPYISSFNVSLSGRNLWFWKHDSFTGSDPEGSLAGSKNGQGIVNYMMPSTRSYSLNMKVTF